MPANKFAMVDELLHVSCSWMEYNFEANNFSRLCVLSAGSVSAQAYPRNGTQVALKQISGF
jgi:hypothetical protein